MVVGLVITLAIVTTAALAILIWCAVQDRKKDKTVFAIWVLLALFFAFEALSSWSLVWALTINQW